MYFNNILLAFVDLDEKVFSSVGLVSELKRRKLKVGDNEPYEGNLIGDTMYKHGLKNNLHHTLIEVRNDLLSSPTKIHRVSVLLKQVINNSINRI